MFESANKKDILKFHEIFLTLQNKGEFRYEKPPNTGNQQF